VAVEQRVLHDLGGEGGRRDFLLGLGLLGLGQADDLGLAEDFGRGATC
jgi:hypothetical protein